MTRAVVVRNQARGEAAVRDHSDPCTAGALADLRQELGAAFIPTGTS